MRSDPTAWLVEFPVVTIWEKLYNLCMDSEAFGLLLGSCLVGMYLLAMLYLRGRDLGTTRYILWGLLALLLPAVGPFLVLIVRPGKVPSAPDRRKL